MFSRIIADYMVTVVLEDASDKQRWRIHIHVVEVTKLAQSVGWRNCAAKSANALNGFSCPMSHLYELTDSDLIFVEMKAFLHASSNLEDISTQHFYFYCYRIVDWLCWSLLRGKQVNVSSISLIFNRRTTKVSCEKFKKCHQLNYLRKEAQSAISAHIKIKSLLE